jgi:hypothetical protein
MARCGQQGCTETMMVAQGFSVKFLAELISDGLASATVERVMAGDKQIGVARVHHRGGAECARRRHGGTRMKWLLEYFGLFGLLALGFVALGVVVLLALRMLL